MRKQSHAPVPFRCFRLTQPIGDATHLAMWNYKGDAFQCLCYPVVDDAGNKSFEGAKVERVSGEVMLRHSKVEGDRKALPADLITMMDDPDDGEAGLEAIGR